MLTKETVAREIETLPQNLLREIYDFILSVKQQNSFEDKIQTHIASEASLSNDWNLKEEDDAWKDL